MRKNISQEFANLFIIFYIHTGTVLWYYTLGKVAKCSSVLEQFKCFSKKEKKKLQVILKGVQGEF